MTRRPMFTSLCLAAVFHLLAPAAEAQDASAVRHRVPAEFMSYLGADWLERAERVDEEQPERVLDAMELRAGDVVADVGCGSGYYARRIARRVQPGGRVYCEDIQPEMLEIMRERAADEGVTGIEPVLGTPTDPRLPAGAIDWVVIADVYHEMSEPEPMLAGIRDALAPGGRVAVLEYRVEDGSGDNIKADHTMSVRQVLAEWQAAGFELVELHDFLPSQHLFFFRAAAGAAGSCAGVSASDVTAAAGVVDCDLFDAIDAGLVEVDPRGAGREAVNLRIRRTGGGRLVVTSPVATLLEADGARDMITRRDGWIVLRDDGWHDWTLRAVGRQHDREPPGPDEPLRLQPPSAIPRLASVLGEVQVGTYTVANSPTLYPPRTHVVEQAAVWIADGDADYGSMEEGIAGPRIPPQYAAAFALVFLDRAGIDVTRRRVWSDRARIFDRLRDQGLNVWYQLKTR
ncbi:MAG: methyltransferase domain-containing protein [Acidobacteria bacterium]|nr:methyltransferase domain-containing protein [Acidobacteriota bacterium]